MAASSDNEGSGHGSGRRPLVFDELRWVVQIRDSLTEDTDDEDDNGIPVSVFNVPKQLLVHKPEAYVPQFIALGPYHHWRPELYEMERYKLAASRRAQRRLRPAGLKLDALVAQFARLERKVRAYYHRYLDFNGETLSWMMVVDGTFLLEFLQIYADIRRRRRRRKSAHNLILRDMLMLENQIPLFLLRKILEPQCASVEEASELLLSMVTGLMKELCPFKMMDGDFPAADVAKHAHLLELLYYLLVPQPPAEDTTEEAHDHDESYDLEELPSDADEKKASGGGSEYVAQLFAAMWSMASKLGNGPLDFVMKPIAFAIKAPWKMLTVVPGVSGIKHPVESFFMSSGADGRGDPSLSSSTAGHLSRPPLIEEIMVPSVSELINAGVQVAATTGSLSTVSFDCWTATLYLPAVTVDSNTELMVRNLVAYESSAASGPLVLTSTTGELIFAVYLRSLPYTELMNGIIDTDEDVALLRQRGVLLIRMKSDGEVTKLWNGMSRSVRLTKVPVMDKAVEEVNRYYNSRWRVKSKRFMRKYIFSSWQLLTFLAAIMMLMLTTLQAFCSVYNCSRWFGAVTVTAATVGKFN
ncbi:unnamed protein product [Alopecurus aequalis]